MSDDRTIRIGPEGPDDRDERAERVRERRRGLIGTGAGLVVAALILAAFVVFGGEVFEDSAEPLASETEATQAPTEPAQETELPATEPAEPEATIVASPEPVASQPSTGDMSAFLRSYEAEHGSGYRSVRADVDRDGVDEVVLARVTDELVHIDVAAWDSAEYAVVFTDEGAPAERLDDFYVRELNGTATMEIVTSQSAGDFGRSVSLWGMEDDEYTRQEASGGCWDGSHTYGITGATVEPGRITATCDGSPDPREVWPADVYEWTRLGWTYVRTEEAE